MAEHDVHGFFRLDAVQNAIALFRTAARLVGLVARSMVMQGAHRLIPSGRTGRQATSVKVSSRLVLRP